MFQYDNRLSLHGLRWRCEDTGAFISKDSFPGATIDPHSLNYYNYAAHDPVNQIDASGEHPAVVVGLIVLEASLTGLDAYTTVQVWRDPAATWYMRLSVTGGTAIGVFAPGGGYGSLAKHGGKVSVVCGNFVGKLPYLKGVAGEAALHFDLFKRGYTKLGTQITYAVDVMGTVVRTRVDEVGVNLRNRLFDSVTIFDAKFGTHAKDTVNQVLTEGIIPGLFTPRGKRAAASGQPVGVPQLVDERKVFRYEDP